MECDQTTITLILYKWSHRQLESIYISNQFMNQGIFIKIDLKNSLHKLHPISYGHNALQSVSRFKSY